MSVVQPQLVIFDMAGTTVRDDGQVPRAFAAALASHGLSATPEQINAVRGASKREAILRFIPPGPNQTREAETVYFFFRKQLTELYGSEGVQEIAGAGAIFAMLRQRGIRVALNTGFDKEITRLLLAALGWSDQKVDAIVCGDDVAHGRPASDLIRAAMRAAQVSDPNHVMNVGDTVLDLQAGSTAGVHWNVGVLTGAHSRAQLQGAPHTHILPSIADILPLLQR